MLHQIFSLDRPLIVFDCETTGTDTAKDHIIEIGFQLFTADGLQKEWRSLVNPGILVGGSHKIHGISDESLKEAPPFVRLAASLARGFTNCDYAGQNVRFDLRILQAEMVRVKQEWSYAGARIIDSSKLEQLGEPRSLKHLYRKHLGHDFEDAHSALADVKATSELIAAQMKAYNTLPRGLDALHDLQWPGFIDPEGKFKFVDGVPNITFGKWAGPMKNVPPDYWSWILKSDFSADVKKIAADAVIGKFPEVK